MQLKLESLFVCFKICQFTLDLEKHQVHQFKIIMFLIFLFKVVDN